MRTLSIINEEKREGANMFANSLRLLMISTLLLVAAPASYADFVAYSIGKKDKSPLPERLDDIDAEHLLNIEWGEYAGRYRGHQPGCFRADKTDRLAPGRRFGGQSRSWPNVHQPWC